MLPDALPQLIDMLLRLSPIEAAQLRELIQHLPDPQAAAQELVHRGWITQDQFSSLFPNPQQRPTPQETMPLGFPDDESPPDADCDWSLPCDDEDKADVPPDVQWARPGRTDQEMLPDADSHDWSLPLGDEEDKADVPPDVECAQPNPTDQEMLPESETLEAVVMLSGAASTPQFEREVLVPPVAGGNEARQRESDTDKLPRQWMGWASNGLLMLTLFLGSFFAGLQLFGAKSTVPLVARQESKEADEGDPAGEVDLPPLLVPNAK
jgi:hypothetical protein